MNEPNFALALDLGADLQSAEAPGSRSACVESSEAVFDYVAGMLYQQS